MHDIVCLGLRATGIPWLLRELFARRRVTVVNYHNPKASVFAAHMGAFARRYSFVGIDDVMRALEAGDFSLLPEKPLLVTMDDGYVGNCELIDVLKTRRIPAVVYAVAGVVDTRRGFWFDLLPHRSSEMARLKHMPDSERRQTLERDFGHTDYAEYDRASALSGKHLRALHEAGATIGSHTVFHPLLGNCSDDVGQYECSEAKRILQELTGTKVIHFALPDDSGDGRCVGWLRKAGYRTCRTGRPGWVTPRTDPFSLPVFGIADGAGVHKAIVQACGLWIYLKLFLRTHFSKNACLH